MKRSNSHDTTEDKPRLKRRAAKNISRTAYLEEEVDSPASEVELVSSDQNLVRRGRKALAGRKRSELRVPRVTIRMVGRSRESDSPIFVAQSMEDVRQNKCGCRGDVCIRICTYANTIFEQGDEEGSGSERSFRGRRKWRGKGV